MTRKTSAFDPDTGAPACAFNIGRGQRRLRAAGGWAALLTAAAAAAALITLGAGPAWRLALFFPLMAGATGLLQAREGT